MNHENDFKKQIILAIMHTIQKYQSIQVFRGLNTASGHIQAISFFKPMCVPYHHGNAFKLNADSSHRY